MVKNKVYPLYLIVILFCFISSLCFGENVKNVSVFTKNDNILILAPHPDDEAVATAGVIQKALKAGAKLKVVLYTNGDNNEPAFIIYEKRLTFRKGEFIHMGEIRREETISAIKYLGVNKNDIIFLGYPDFGTMEIFTKYWDTTKPFKSFFTRSTKVPYPGCLSLGAPYVGESILKDLKTILAGFKPTRIFVSHPVDTSQDHRSLYLFLRIALWDLEGAIKQPQVLPYIIHVAGWPKPKGYYPELGLEEPLAFTEVSWNKLSLTPDEIAAKYKCISFYKSEIEYDPSYLFTFARKNELFGDYPTIELENQGQGEMRWQGVNIEKTEWITTTDKEIEQRAMMSGLAYASKNGDFCIRINLKRKIDRNFGISVFLLGYNKNKDFAFMPKIHISIGIMGMHIKDKKQTISIKDAEFDYEGNSIIVKIPFSSLGNPDYILSSARIANLPFSNTAWRIIKIK